MRSSGFTLVEVLVAMLLASFGIAALTRSAQAIIRSRIESERLLAMSRLAAKSLEEMLPIDPSTTSPQDLADQVSDPLGPFARSRQIRPGPRENLWHLRVTVRSPLGREMSLDTFHRYPWS